MPADWEDPNSQDWEPPPDGNSKHGLRCSHYRKHRRPAMLRVKVTKTSQKTTKAYWIGERPYCHKCYRSFGEAGRRKMEMERRTELASHRLRPDPDRAYTEEESLADCRAQLATALNYGCHHRDLLSHHKRRKNWNCLCLYMYKHNGIPLIDRTWEVRTRKMREEFIPMDESSPEFRWEMARCLNDVKVHTHININSFAYMIHQHTDS